MPIRPLPLRPALLFATLALALAGCKQRGETPAAPTADPATPQAVASATVETSGLVGPGMGTAERIEVTDVGPPGAVILFTASLKGYTEPCGCTLDLVLGGIDRVSGFVREAAALGTASLVLDGGNTLFETPTLHPASVAQEIRKTEVLTQALRVMGTAATVPGPNDLANGLDFYVTAMQTAGAAILGANVTRTDGSALGPVFLERPLDTERVAVVGAVDHELFATISDLRVTEPRPAVDAAVAAAREAGASTVVLLYHGTLASARRAFADIEGVDFIVLGHAPRRTDEVERIGSAWTLEAYDQGRYVGRLKLVRNGADATGAWSNARAGSDEEIAQLEQTIAGLQERLALLPAPAPGEPEPPILAAQRARIAEYEQELETMRSGSLDFDAAPRTFLWQPTPMEPGYATLDEISTAMVAYNRDLASIAASVVEEVPPVPEGHASYVGGERCATCHVEEHAFWQTTQHATAWATLEERDKTFDRNCIGCHVTGYRQPGGAVLGHLDGLTNVQCEQCHGPGSLHVANPTLHNVPGGVMTQVTEATCAGACHVPEHSPRFEYEAYLQRILGPGHGR